MKNMGTTYLLVIKHKIKAGYFGRDLRGKEKKEDPARCIDFSFNHGMRFAGLGGRKGAIDAGKQKCTFDGRGNGSGFV